MSKYSEHLKGFIDALANNDNVSAENDFNNAMAVKIADAIEALIKSLGLTLPNSEGDRIAIPVRNDERKGPRNLPKR